ncbi:carbonic anhydrase 7 [Platysternon megacephalum]|uniref:Carbonic anhydrase 7 n=1 Tax=Platysternon megacephalum TaxID=55544 RepID=A0A4D9F2L2_9SAUR|nr:carbonic anhydrase 7 [Platysternon megacephalum]
MRSAGGEGITGLAAAGGGSGLSVGLGLSAGSGFAHCEEPGGPGGVGSRRLQQTRGAYDFQQGFQKILFGITASLVLASVLKIASVLEFVSVAETERSIGASTSILRGAFGKLLQCCKSEPQLSSVAVVGGKWKNPVTATRVLEK